MRTTLSLDDDVAAQLEQLRARGDRPLKQIVNDALRVGLSRLEPDEPARRGPWTRSVSLGRALLPDVDDVADALAVGEGEDHR